MSVKCFGPVTLRPVGEKWWALNKRETGLASYGYEFAFLGEALDHFELVATAFGVDKHGLYVTGVPISPATPFPCSLRIAS